MRFLTVLAFLMLPMAASAQEAEPPSKPATKLEAFQANTGFVVVRGYTTVGTIRGLGGDISIDAREFRNAGNPTRRVTGISVSVKETARLERENTSFIDVEEIESLLKGIDYISKVTKEITSLDNFEAEYRTKGEFRIVVFNNSSGQLQLTISSGRIGRTSAYLKIEQLTELKNLIVSAKEKL